MPRGGRRPGAGRPRGRAETRHIRVSEEAADLLWLHAKEQRTSVRAVVDALVLPEPLQSCRHPLCSRVAIVR